MDDEIINEAIDEMRKQHEMTAEEQTEYDRIMAESIPTNVVVDSIPTTDDNKQ